MLAKASAVLFGDYDSAKWHPANGIDGEIAEILQDEACGYLYRRLWSFDQGRSGAICHGDLLCRLLAGEDFTKPSPRRAKLCKAAEAALWPSITASSCRKTSSWLKC